MQYRLGVDAGASTGTSAMGGATTVPNNGGTANPARQGNAWHPTVAYLVVLILAEYGAYLMLRYVFRHAHGG